MNLLKYKISLHERWSLRAAQARELPEIILEGEHVVHMDEEGNVLLDDVSDQRLHHKQRDSDEFEELFEAVTSSYSERGKELIENLIEDEKVYLERLRNLS